MTKKERQDKIKNLHVGLSAQRGIRRAEHFADGGSPAEWRGIKTVTKNRKRSASRRVCRGRVER
jgi:hypothetical protein